LRGRRLRPVEAVQTWLAAARITEGPIFRQVNKSRRVLPGALTAESVATVVKEAAERAGLDPARFGRTQLAPRLPDQRSQGLARRFLR
jgi:hypothetical protein